MIGLASAFALFWVIGAVPPVAADASRDGAAVASATIVQPLAIQSSVQMSFGKLHYVGKPGPLQATVVLSATAPVSRTSDGAQLLPNGGESPAIRILTGQPGRFYRVTISNTVSFPGDMRVSNFTIWSANRGDISASRTGTLDGSGRDTLRIGASLSVPRGAKNATYTATPSITISYE